jgi:hypothetical protein
MRLSAILAATNQHMGPAGAIHGTGANINGRRFLGRRWFAIRTGAPMIVAMDIEQHEVAKLSLDIAQHLTEQA